jgi:hypothetical protein
MGKNDLGVIEQASWWSSVGESSCFPIFSELKESQAGACSYKNSAPTTFIHIEAYPPVLGSW